MPADYRSSGMDELLALDKANIWHPYTPLQGGPDPILIDSAEGLYLTTRDGRRLMDAISSWWVNIHGHCNKYIQKAIADQASVLEHVIFAGFTHEAAIHLSQGLLRILPANQQKIFLSDNGSTAVEVGIKMALQYWHNQRSPKGKIVAVRGAYHGDTFGAMAVGERGLFTLPFQSHLFEVSFIDFPSGQNDQEVIDQFERITKSNDVAAFIYEPLVQGASGMRIYAPATLDSLLTIARHHEVVCIADEVFTGFGRTGKIFASDYLTNLPDIVTTSKGITGGFLPLGATSCSQAIATAFDSPESTKTFYHGHSYTANPISCAAANASLKLLVQDECQRQIGMISERQAAFARTMQQHPAVLKAKSLGTILALELKTREASGYTNTIRNDIYEYFLKRNILLRPLGNTLYVLPPYIIAEGELALIHREISGFLDAR